MNLIYTFPEVEVFFKNQRFTQEELLYFIQSVEKKYDTIELRKAVATLISLKILQYDAFPDEFEQINIVAKYNRLKLESKRPYTIQELLDELINYSVQNIAVSLDWDLQKLLRLLELKDIHKTEKEFLTAAEYKTVKEMFKTRLLALQRIEKSNTIKFGTRRITTPSADTNDVYAKIQVFGLGKVIYIRKS
jgi:hypothetical protein